MSIILPISELRNTNKINELCNQSLEPIFVTKNGYGAMVVLSMDAYQNMKDEIELNHQIQLSKNEINQGDFDTFENIVRRLNKKYEL